MQSLQWYVRRLRSMSPAEVGWRCASKARGFIDRRTIAKWQKPFSLEDILIGQPEEAVTDEPLWGEHLADGDLALTAQERLLWTPGLVEEADRVGANRLRLFDRDDVAFGDQMDWNCEPKANRKVPLSVAMDIDYRDHRIVGDCKWVWEPSRCHQFVVLARAWRVTGNVRYARAVVDQMASWIDQCPYGLGMNWRSPLELAIRLINWVWALELIRGANVMPTALRDRVLRTVYLHLRQITRYYSRYSSANNHLIGEAVGVLVATSYFTGFRDSARWRREAADMLAAEIQRQTYADGGTREQAVGYHFFVLQFLLIAGLVGRRTGCDFDRAYWDRLERMFDFVAALSEGGDPPMFGDSDDGYVLDLGDRDEPVSSTLCIGAVLFERPAFKAAAGSFTQSAFWLLGSSGRERFEQIETVDVSEDMNSRALSESGYYLLQTGHRNTRDRISVMFDCGELGYGAIAAHGHADALSLTVRVGGVDLLVDPGTYDYFTYPDWRLYFRGTRAHNTLMLDEQDQSAMLGSFLWGSRALSRCLQWAPDEHGGSVSGEHDGYRRLPSPAMHRRSVTLADGLLTVVDDVQARGPHDVSISWHFAEGCRIQPDFEMSNRFAVVGDTLSATITVDAGLSVSIVKGCPDPILGWMSRGYHRKAPSPTLLARVACEGSFSFTTRIDMRAVGGEGVPLTGERKRCVNTSALTED